MKLLACLLWLFAVCIGQSSAEIDFSTCGYEQSAYLMPDVPAQVLVLPGKGDEGDDTSRIQAGIDYVAGLHADAAGFRGAVLLAPGDFRVRGQLLLRSSGVVLRGSGVELTKVFAKGQDRQPLIRVVGKADRKIDSKSARPISADQTIPAGAPTFSVDDVSEFNVGDTVIITRPSTKKWIESVGMDHFGTAWKPGSRDVRWERRIKKIEQNRIEIDAPITLVLDSRHGGGRIEKMTWPGRIRHLGIENLQLVSVPATDNPKDEDHAWVGIAMENVKDAWVRQVTFRGFAGSAVALYESTKNVTVRDCVSLEPISEVGGYRRNIYFPMGQQSLFLRCWSENGRHDFAVGHCAAGPNAFVSCEARGALDYSGPIESWATGVLYDNVRINGAGLRLANRWTVNQGAGWCAANSTIWQSSAAEIHCFNPPGASNRAIGIWGTCVGDGDFDQVDEFVKPRSLFHSQLAKRIGRERTKHLGPIGRDTKGATNPSYSEAEAFAQESNQARQTLREIIEQADGRDTIPIDALAVPTIEEIGVPRVLPFQPPEAKLELRDGRLCIGERPLQGKRFTPIWWRGNIRPGGAQSFGPAVTRFVPGRVGRGFTDDLNEVAKELRASGFAVFEHHHGLWYDRRRDDHLRVRRANGDVIPPFYEQPFARSGLGEAWDGLSKYDLTKFNPWYWRRLKEFADRCDENGLVLLLQHYFQHNLLEAGAHWADFPWRSVNNINDTGFPEPPPYAGDKRIFQAHLFYDISHKRRRDLHRGYIRQHLANTAANSNVIHSLGAEFTGPREFMQFWIDTIIEWERETRRDVLVSLSCTKDVQDAILADPSRVAAISIIDIRYWWYTSDGKLYAPEGGKNLSPRQRARQLKPKGASTASKRRALNEYRKRYPEKVVLFDGEVVE